MKAIAWLLMLVPLYAFSAPTLQWDASDGAEGYNLYCGAVPVGTVDPIDVGTAVTYDLSGTVTSGVQYECWVTAYAAGLPDSADSNHIMFTQPAIVQTMVIPAQPSSVTISWQ